LHDIAQQLGENLVGPLRRTRPWMKFVAIVGFIESGFALIGALIIMAVFSTVPLPQESPRMPHGLFVSMGLMELIAAALIFVPSLLLFRYAMSLDRIEKNGTLETLAKALERQHAFWKFVGICLIIGICMWLLGMIAMIAFSFSMAAAQLH
jgi:hypothetical protein